MLKNKTNMQSKQRIKLVAKQEIHVLTKLHWNDGSSWNTTTVELYTYVSSHRSYSRLPCGIFSPLTGPSSAQLPGKESILCSLGVAVALMKVLWQDGKFRKVIYYSFCVRKHTFNMPEAKNMFISTVELSTFSGDLIQCSCMSGRHFFFLTNLYTWNWSYVKARMILPWNNFIVRVRLHTKSISKI
jgi:hypothetical protein